MNICPLLQSNLPRLLYDSLLLILVDLFRVRRSQSHEKKSLSEDLRRDRGYDAQPPNTSLSANMVENLCTSRER